MDTTKCCFDFILSLFDDEVTFLLQDLGITLVSLSLSPTRRYVTGTGDQRIEQGYLKNPESEHPIQVMEGAYSYTGSDGVVSTGINY